MHYTNILLAGLCLGLCFDTSAMERVLKKPKEAEASQEAIHNYFIPLESSDGQSFEISQELAALSPRIMGEICQYDIGTMISLPIDGATLKQVIAALTKLAQLQTQDLESLKAYPVTEETVVACNNSLLTALYDLGIPIVVDLVSNDNHSVRIPFQVAWHSEILKSLLMDAGNSQAIFLSGINGATLTLMTKLLYKLDELMMRRAQDVYLYIPRAFQPYVSEYIGKIIDDVALKGNEALTTCEWNNNSQQQTVTPFPQAIPLFNENPSAKTLDVALELLYAANYLDNYYLVNAVAAVIVDQIPKDLYDAVLKVLSDSDKDDVYVIKAQEAVSDSSCKRITLIPKDLCPYICKHITHRKWDITEEYSIADLIKEHGQPTLETVVVDVVMPQCLDLRKKKLTSLSGLKLLEKGPQAECLLLEKNCFYDISLDKDVEEPFADCGNVRQLYLNNNRLCSLPEGLFTGLNRLELLRLNSNQLSALPVGLFNGLISLRLLRLESNELCSLPGGLFNGLTSLTELHLKFNQLRELPGGLFSGLTSLQRLYLDGNQLCSLSEGLFNGLNRLQWLHLENNQLCSLPGGLFSGLNRLQSLYLENNQLCSLSEGLFNGLTSLAVLYLSNNQLSTLSEGLFNGLTSLTGLHLENNLLITLPGGLFVGLNSLFQLDLDKNQLSTLPEGLFSGLNRLQWLYLHNNQLSDDLKSSLVKELQNKVKL